MGNPKIKVPEKQLATFFDRHHIIRLSLFGSVLRDDFGPESDIDVLVEFEPDHMPGWEIVDMSDELSVLLGGHRIELHAPLVRQRKYHIHFTVAAMFMLHATINRPLPSSDNPISLTSFRWWHRCRGFYE